MVTKYTAGMIVTLSLWGPRSSRVMLHRPQDIQDSQGLVARQHASKHTTQPVIG